MNTKLLDIYGRQWPRVAAVQAMALGGASLLAGRKNQANLRALAVMNAMTWRRTWAGCLTTSIPATVARPASGRASVVRIRTAVVLPAP